MRFNPGLEAGPSDYEIGVDFDYSVWDENTVISLFSVRWDAAYDITVGFENRAALNAYLDSTPGKIDLNNMSYARPFEGVSIDLPHNRASRFNYVRVSNPAMPISGDLQKDYYYFITGVSWESAESTRLTLQLDAFQTYIYDVTFGNCYLERSHLGIAAANNFESFGRQWLTVAEGIDTGAEYRTIATRREVVMGTEFIFSNGQITADDNTCVIVITTQDITVDPGTKEAPNRVTSKGSSFSGIASGAGYWVFQSQQSFTAWMSSISTTPWVGESVIAAFMAPRIDRYVASIQYNPHGIPTNLNGVIPIPLKHYLWDNWRDSAEILNAIPLKYRHLKKFFTFPYMMIELTTWTGTPITLKPEVWNSPNATLLERVSLVAPGQRIEFHAQRYNSADGVNIDNFAELPDSTVDLFPAESRERYRDVGDDHGDYWDHATKITNLPSVALVNDGAISYLASNTHGLTYQAESADWTQRKALRGAEVSHRNTGESLDTSSRITDIGNASALLQTGNVNRTQVATQIASGSGNTLAGLVGGGNGITNVGVGMIASGIQSGAQAVSTGIEIAARDEATAISNMASRTIADQSYNTGGEINDRNKALADFAANGDKQNAIAGITAKINDSRMIQPTMAGQAGGETINLANNMVQVSARWKMVDEANTRRIGDFWLRWGYALNMIYRPTTLKVMSKFSYWKMVECQLISAPMPEVFKDAIRGIFLRGTTVYANPSDIGTVNIADNAPMEGFTL